MTKSILQTRSRVNGVHRDVISRQQHSSKSIGLAWPSRCLLFSPEDKSTPTFTVLGTLWNRTPRDLPGVLEDRYGVLQERSFVAPQQETGPRPTRRSPQFVLPSAHRLMSLEYFTRQLLSHYFSTPWQVFNTCGGWGLVSRK